MTSSRLAALSKQFEAAKAGIEKIERAIADRGDTEGTEKEVAELETLFTRAEELEAEIEPIAKREKSLAATAGVLEGLGISSTRTTVNRAGAGDDGGKAPPAMTAGEYLSAFYRANVGGDPEAEEMIRRVADQLTTDNPGIIPKEIVGNLLNFVDATRPVFASLTSRPMPEKGKTFSRPRITQHVLVGEQLVEKTELASRKMTIAGEDVTKRTFGGVLDISQQDLDWTEPALLEVVLQDFADMYAIVSEEEAVDFLVAAATVGGAGTWDPTDIGTLISSITTGMQTVYGTAKRMPDRLWLSMDEAFALAATTNTDDSVTAISMINQALAAVGVKLDITMGPLLPADTRILGVSSLAESYEKRNGLIQAVNVPLLGWDVGYSAYLAFYGRAEGLLKLNV